MHKPEFESKSKLPKLLTDCGIFYRNVAKEHVIHVFHLTNCYRIVKVENWNYSQNLVDNRLLLTTAVLQSFFLPQTEGHRRCYVVNTVNFVLLI